MNSNKSLRSDVPSIRFVKLSEKIISSYLSKLYKNSVEYGVFPESLKYAEVPFYKNGKKNDVNNYRPISLLSHFSKTFQSLVCERLNSYSVANDLFRVRAQNLISFSLTETSLA